MPFEKGKSGNPCGRPKGTRTTLMTDTLLLLMRRSVTSNSKTDKETGKKITTYYIDKPKGKNMSAMEMMCLAQVNNAIRGDIVAFNTIYDRIEGKVSQPVRGDDDPEAPPVRTQDETIKELARSTAFLLMAGAKKE